MERLKRAKESLMNEIEGALTHLNSVDTKELGEAIDMVKDLSEAIYYCTVTKAMEEKEKTPQPMYYWERPYQYNLPNSERMYYGGNSGGNNSGSSNSSSSSYYTEPYMNTSNYGEMRDVREGRSPVSRRMYMETKEAHRGQPEKMKDLEKYLKELAEDITEMIDDASPEEKAMLQQKLSNLINKIK